MDSSTIMIFIDWYYPAYKAGGPIKSVHNIVKHLQGDFNFIIVTSNSDIDAIEIEVKTNSLLTAENHQIIYLERQFQTVKYFTQLIEECKPDILYFNSLFSVKFTLIPIIAGRRTQIKKYIIAPRGMLTQSALSIKPTKKKVFLSIAKRFIFNSEKFNWHASTIQEKNEILGVFKNARVHIAQNLSSGITIRSNENLKKLNELRLVAISRISAIKNIYWLLKVLNNNKLSNCSLSIYGPIEEEAYWEKCKKYIDDSRISYKGILHPNQVIKTIQEYHYFISPSKNENYGHTISEAICSGVPVIVSQGTPWRNLLEYNIGNDISLEEEEAWINYLSKLYTQPTVDYNKMVESCLDYAERFIFTEELIEENKKLFRIGE